jgi:hypothetical protein
VRVRILRDRRFAPPEYRGRVSVHYTAGLELTVKRAWGAALVAAGDALELEPPPRPDRKG